METQYKFKIEGLIKGNNKHQVQSILSNKLRDSCECFSVEINNLGASYCINKGACVQPLDNINKRGQEK